MRIKVSEVFLIFQFFFPNLTLFTPRTLTVLTMLLQVNNTYNKFLVSKETVVLRRWERSKQKFGFIKRVDKG